MGLPATLQDADPLPCAPTNGWPCFPFGFLGAGGRLAKVILLLLPPSRTRIARLLCNIYSPPVVLGWSGFGEIRSYASTLLGRLRRTRSALRRLRTAQQLSDDSTQVGFQISKIFFFSSGIVPISDSEIGPMSPLLSFTKSDPSRCPRPVIFSVPTATFRCCCCCCCCCIVSPTS